MDSHRFHPRLDTLEARHTPSVSPAQVVYAAQFAEMADGVMEQLGDRIGGPLRTETLDEIKAFMPRLAFAQHWAAGVLAEFHADLVQRMAVDPASAVDLAPYAERTAAAAATATATTARADVFAVTLGQPSVQQQLDAQNPPPADTGSNTGDGTDTKTDDGTKTDTPTGPLSTTDDSGMSDTIPPLDDPNWVAMPSGLRVWTVNPGEGTPVDASSKITVFYTGWLKDTGARFETNRPSTPNTFNLTGLIQGWQQGLPGLKPGGLVRLDIPSALAYGAAGSPPNIPGNADLVFEIKVLAVS